MALSYHAAVVRVGLLDVKLAQDRPGIVTDFVASAVPPGSRHSLLVSNQLSDGPLGAVTECDALWQRSKRQRAI